MVDPISVISLVEGSIGLVLQCGSVAKTLGDIIAKFKHAEVAIMSLIQEVETIKFAWSRIKEWSEEHAEAATDSQFVQRLERSLRCGTLVLSALEEDLADYKHPTDNASFKLRSKMAWNERAFLDHQHRVRGQVQAMTLMLQVSQLSTSEAQTKLLRKKEKAFRASDESAYSIVPSRMSSHMSVSTRSRDSVLTIEGQELVYYPLSFEDDLFTARVYKRNYRNPWINSLVKLHWGKKKEERRVPTAKTEASEDGQSLLSSLTGTTTPTIMSLDVSQPWPSNQEISLRDLRPVSPRPPLPGTIPSTFEKRASVDSGLQKGAMDSSIKAMHPAEGQPDIFGAISPATGHISQRDDESNVAVARSSPALEAQYEMKLLLLAVEEGKLDKVKTLINRGAQVNPHPVINIPPLYFAICKHDVSMTELLVQEGANYKEEWRGTPPIHQACKDEDIKIVRLLLDAGASVSSLDALQQQPLHVVLSSQASSDDTDLLRDLLISRGADVNALTQAGETPLHLTCKYANVGHVRALLACGANPNSTDEDGRTALHILALNVRVPLYHYEDYPATFRLLHEHGAKLEAEDEIGDTPFHLFVKRSFVHAANQLPSHRAFFGLLLGSGATMNDQNRAGDTILHILVTQGFKERFSWTGYRAIIQLLLDSGVNVNVRNRVGDTLLHIPVTQRLKEWSDYIECQAVVQLLLQHGVNVNAQNKVGDTPLHILLTAGLDGRPDWIIDQAVVQSLIKHGAQVNIYNVAGDTPLHIIARCDPLVEEDAEWKDQLIGCLFDAGADPFAKNLKEESPLQLLYQFNDRSVLLKALPARPQQKTMSEVDEDEIGVAS